MTKPVGTQSSKSTVSLWRRLLRSTLLFLLLVLLLFGFLQRQLMYHPSTSAALNVQDYPELLRMFPESKDVAIRCADGVLIRGWLLRKTASDRKELRRPLAIYYHGNAGNRGGRANWYHLLHDAGADVLAIDYHGYGDSGGKMSESGMEYDCDATWTFATTELGYDPSQIVVVGTSLGGAAAVYTTWKQCTVGDAPPAGLALTATFSSMTEVAGSHYPWLPVNLMLVDRYPSEDRIKNVTCRILSIHGDRDTVVEQRFGRKLFDAAPEASSGGDRKVWVNLEGVDHNDLFDGDQSDLQNAMNDLFRRVSVQSTASVSASQRDE